MTLKDQNDHLWSEQRHKDVCALIDQSIIIFNVVKATNSCYKAYRVNVAEKQLVPATNRPNEMCIFSC